MSEIRARMAYRWEAMQLRFSRKRFGFWILFNLVAVVFISALIIFYLERGKNPGIHSYWDALYMVFITIATVGYGDITPVTAGGRVTVIITLILGIGALSGFITLMATRRAEKARRRYSGLEVKTESRNHIVVCGWNSRGKFVLDRLGDELEKERTLVILLCDLEEAPTDEEKAFFLRGNPVSEADLRRANVAEARAAILLADESKGGSSGDVDARTVLTALTVRGINPEIKMTAEVLEPENIHHLELAGVGEILDTNCFLGNLIARSAIHYGLIKTMTGIVTREAGSRIYTLHASAEMVGRTKTEVEAALLKEHGAVLLAIGTKAGFKPHDEDYRIEEGDFLTVSAQEKPPGAITQQEQR
ncbi:MAG: potassium channel protein [Actinobacteria bacterium]|jgi:voltage-gated potassium channel|nr:MAG: potassium channel protein [Actinomycetota bacterium]